MVKNSSKNNRKHVGTRVGSRRKVDKYAKGAKALGWDAKRTVRQNLEASGLAAALNDHASIIRQRGLRLNKASASEFLAMVDDQLPASSALTAAAERNPARGKFFMKDEEVLYLQVRGCLSCLSSSLFPPSSQPAPAPHAPRSRSPWWPSTATTTWPCFAT
jgi:hypothetical protein